MSRLLKIIGLFCKRALQKDLYSPKAYVNTATYIQICIAHTHTFTPPDTDTDTDTDIDADTDIDTDTCAAALQHSHSFALPYRIPAILLNYVHHTLTRPHLQIQTQTQIRVLLYCGIDVCVLCCLSVFLFFCLYGMSETYKIIGLFCKRALCKRALQKRPVFSKGVCKHCHVSSNMYSTHTHIHSSME